MQFIDRKSQKCTLDVFIEQWAGDYYKYTNISDTVFYYCQENIRRNQQNTHFVSIIGAWKEGCLGLRDYGTGIDFICPKCNNKYYFNNRWREDCPIALNGWMYIGNHLNKIISRIDNEPNKIFNELSNKRFPGYNNKKERIERFFRPIFTSTIFNFISPQRYAIIDRFASMALEYIYGNSSIIVKDFDDYQHYNNLFFRLNNHNHNHINTNIVRKIDKALFSFGHFLDNNENINKNIRTTCSKDCYL